MFDICVGKYQQQHFTNKKTTIQLTLLFIIIRKNSKDLTTIRLSADIHQHTRQNVLVYKLSVYEHLEQHNHMCILIRHKNRYSYVKKSVYIIVSNSEANCSFVLLVIVLLWPLMVLARAYWDTLLERRGCKFIEISKSKVSNLG